MAIYLDNNATTKIAPEVLDAMMPYLTEHFGNASSVHRYGRLIKGAMEQARMQVADLVGAHPSQVIFTASGTEANNFALRGLIKALVKGRIAISAIEHSSMRELAYVVRNEGWGLDEIPVNANGQVDIEGVKAALHEDTRFVSVMKANNETGVIQDIAAISQLTKDAGIVMHSDCTQAAGKIAIDFEEMGVQLMTLSSHKLYGPLGAGALIVDKSVSLTPLIVGGGHERGLRSGTENIPAIVGFGKAAELAKQQLESRAKHALKLRERIEHALRQIPSAKIFADHTDRLPNTLQFGLHGCHGETLLMQLDMKGVAVSSGSACKSGTHKASHVLSAMGVDSDTALTAVRVSIGRQNTEQELDQFISILSEIAQSQALSQAV